MSSNYWVYNAHMKRGRRTYIAVRYVGPMRTTPWGVAEFILSTWSRCCRCGVSQTKTNPKSQCAIYKVSGGLRIQWSMFVLFPTVGRILDPLRRCDGQYGEGDCPCDAPSFSGQRAPNSRSADLTSDDWVVIICIRARTGIAAVILSDCYNYFDITDGIACVRMTKNGVYLQNPQRSDECQPPPPQPRETPPRNRVFATRTSIR